jgi:hypothetical protein
MPATSTIAALTLVLAVNLTDAAVFPTDDANGNTRKATIAQMRTQLNTGAQIFTTSVSVGTTLTVTGLITATAGVTVTGGTLASGANLFKNAVDGLTVVGIAGSTSDYQLYNAAGNPVMRVPTGTQNVVVAGAMTATDYTVGDGSTTVVGVSASAGAGATKTVTIALAANSGTIMQINVGASCGGNVGKSGAVFWVYGDQGVAGGWLVTEGLRSNTGLMTISAVTLGTNTLSFTIANGSGGYVAPFSVAVICSTQSKAKPTITIT